MNPTKRYLAILACTFGALCAATSALGVAVDPYYLFGTPLVSGWNQLKPAAYERSAAAKTRLLERAAPRTLLIGNSRIEVGLDPESPEWPIAMRPVFNAGLGGRDLTMSAKFLEDALAGPGLQHALVGVDVLDFLQEDTVAPPPGPVYGGTDQNRMRVLPDMTPNPGMLRARTEDVFASILTLDAVIDGVTTVFGQGGAATMTPLGFNPLQEYRDYVKLHGFRDLFDQKQVQYVTRFPKYIHPDFADPYRTRNFRALREILQTAEAKKLDLTLIIYPYHAWVMDLIRSTGIWGSFEAWKRALVRVVAEQDPVHRVRLVDFSGYNIYTKEAVPAVGDFTTELRWYWEPGHFRPALGDRIIDRLYDGRNDGFGRDLSATTLDDVIAAIRQEVMAKASAASRN